MFDTIEIEKEKDPRRISKSLYKNTLSYWDYVRKGWEVMKHSGDMSNREYNNCMAFLNKKEKQYNKVITGSHKLWNLISKN